MGQLNNQEGNAEWRKISDKSKKKKERNIHRKHTWMKLCRFFDFCYPQPVDTRSRSTITSKDIGPNPVIEVSSPNEKTTYTSQQVMAYQSAVLVVA